MGACVFCQIAAGEMNAEVVYEDELIMAFNDIHPEAPVHVLVIPKQHIESLAHIGESERDVMAHLMLKVPEIALLKGLSQGFKTRINTGRAGGQEVNHLHLHLTGRLGLTK